jgi:prepilin-type N-terminal cleavage/methylation domain-containing protein
MSRRQRLLRLVRGERGYTMIELLISMSILGTITAAVTVLFLQASTAEVDMNRRFKAQQEARVAVDRMRREIHCASGIVSTATTVTATLPGHCPSAVGGATTTVVYSFQNVSASRYKLRRTVNGGAAATVADYITSDSAFAYTAPSSSSLGKLNVDFRVNVKPDEGWKTWRLQTDIVLRNTTRA